MDCQMPVMDGYTATREIRKNPAFHSLPIIALTANAMAGDKEKVLNAGMNDHIAKPLNLETMFGTMARWIHPKRALQAEMVAMNSVAGGALGAGARGQFDEYLCQGWMCALAWRLPWATRPCTAACCARSTMVKRTLPRSLPRPWPRPTRQRLSVAPHTLEERRASWRQRGEGAEPWNAPASSGLHLSRLNPCCTRRSTPCSRWWLRCTACWVTRLWPIACRGGYGKWRPA